MKHLSLILCFCLIKGYIINMNRNRNYYFFIAISVIGLLYLFQIFLMPLLLALVFSICSLKFIDKIPVKSIKTKALIISLSIGLIIVVPLSILISIGANESVNFFKNIEIIKYINSDFLYKKDWIKSILKFFTIDHKSFEALFNQYVFEIRNILVTSLQSFVYKIPLILFNFSVMITAIYFMITDGHRVKRIFSENFVYDEKLGKVIVSNFANTSWAVMVATFGSALIQTLIVFVPSLFINSEYAILIAFATFIFSMIPIIGTVPVMGILFFYYFSKDEFVFAFIYVGLGFLIGFVDSIVRMVVLEKKVKINPFIAFLSTMVGINIFGFFGLILGPIVIVTLLKILLFTLRTKNNKKD